MSTITASVVGKDPVSLQLSAAVQSAHEIKWYAAYTCANHERRVAQQLAERRFESFLPTYRSVRRWKDRRKELQLALGSRPGCVEHPRSNRMARTSRPTSIPLPPRVGGTRTITFGLPSSNHLRQIASTKTPGTTAHAGSTTPETSEQIAMRRSCNATSWASGFGSMLFR